MKNFEAQDARISQILMYNNVLKAQLEEQNNYIKELTQERDFYKRALEKKEEMLENPNKNYD
jgi:hypothetical protein